jgi:pyruvate/2-oxoglutarate dehydrogenase complex dihydrolipoamide acyltransferase (E2) component
MANNSVFTGSDGSLTLSVPSGAEGDVAKKAIDAGDLVSVGRVQGVRVEVHSDVRAFNEIGQRYPAQLRPGNVSIRGTIDRAYINGAMLQLCLGDAASSRPAASWAQPAFNITLLAQNAASPSVRNTLTLHDVKIENWALDVPESDFLMESVSFQALFVSVQDEG